MAHFHIVHIFPDARLHIMNGYNDVIRTLIWGLRCHGHEVTYAVNHQESKARNIVFGANWLDTAVLQCWPPGTIIYNLEQIDTMLGIEDFSEIYQMISERFVIWDYSLKNIEVWRSLNDAGQFFHIPIAYSPILRYVDRDVKQDIDVLIYGNTSGKRLDIFDRCCKMHLNSVFAFGFYGDARDALIARSKMVLNIHQDNATIFSIVRVGYLMANSKAIISDLPSNGEIEADIAHAILMATFPVFDNFAYQLARDDQLRLRYEEAAFEAMAQRDIRSILAPIVGM